MDSLKNKTVFITGGTRGIGRAIALKLASHGATIVLAAKTKDPHPKLEGTLDEVIAEIQAAGGQGLGIQTDVRYEDQIQKAVQETVGNFGGIDILVNNAGAIQLTDTLNTSMNRFDLMMGVNVRAAFACVQACLPHLQRSSNPHVLMLSPPISLKAKWLKDHCAYTISKYGMSLCVLGMAEEFKPLNIAVNALWPKTIIATAAIKMIGGDPILNRSRKPDIMADAAYHIFTQKSSIVTGNFFIDEDVLKSHVTDFESYSVMPGAQLTPDFFID